MKTEVIFDPYDHETQDDPFPLYEVLRRDAPVYRDPGGRFWAISRYEACRQALIDHETFSNEGGIILGADVSMMPKNMVLVDPPEHTRLRTLVTLRAFTPRRIASYEEAIRESVNEFIDAFADRDEVDLVPSFAQMVPVRAISDIIGVPREDRDRFRHWADTVLTDPTSPAGVEAAMKCMAYFHEVLEDRRRNPRDDLMTGIVQAEVQGERLTAEEQLGMVLLLFLAGIETTQFHLSNACYEIGLHRDLQDRLRREPHLIPGAMEEILRFDAPVQGDIRTLKRDAVIDGVRIPEGETVLVLFGSANRDPSVFPDPDRLDITRDPNPHLSFAGGPHFCLGAPLVRLESRVAFETLFARMPPYRLVEEGVRRAHTNGPFMRGLAAVPVRFDAG